MMVIIVVNGGGDFYTTMVSYGPLAGAGPACYLSLQLSASVTQLRPCSLDV